MRMSNGIKQFIVVVDFIIANLHRYKVRYLVFYADRYYFGNLSVYTLIHYDAFQ